MKQKGKRYLLDLYRKDPREFLKLLIAFFPQETINVKGEIDVKHIELYRRMAERAGMFDANGRLVGTSSN